MSEHSNSYSELDQKKGLQKWENGKELVLCDQYFCVGNDLCKQYSCALHQTQNTIKRYTEKLCLSHICLTVCYP